MPKIVLPVSLAHVRTNFSRIHLLNYSGPGLWSLFCSIQSESESCIGHFACHLWPASLMRDRVCTVKEAWLLCAQK